jgi:plastocyanin
MLSTHRHLRAVAALAAVLALGFTAARAAPPAAQVTIDNFSFSPMTVTVPVGGQVTWTNGDDIPHTVRAVDGSFHSKALDSGDAFTASFAKPGVYAYFCSVHPKMVGKVIVRAQ